MIAWLSFVVVFAYKNAESKRLALIAMKEGGYSTYSQVLPEIPTYEIPKNPSTAEDIVY